MVWADDGSLLANEGAITAIQVVAEHNSANSVPIWGATKYRSGLNARAQRASSRNPARTRKTYLWRSLLGQWCYHGRVLTDRDRTQKLEKLVIQAQPCSHGLPGRLAEHTSQERESHAPNSGGARIRAYSNLRYPKPRAATHTHKRKTIRQTRRLLFHLYKQKVRQRLTPTSRIQCGHQAGPPRQYPLYPPQWTS